MEKVIHGLWRAPDADPAPIAATLLDEVAPALLDLGVHGLRILVEEPAAAAMRYGANPDGQVLTASVGVWLDSIDDRQRVLDALAAAGCTTHAFLVTESVPLAYETVPTLEDLLDFDRFYSAGGDPEELKRRIDRSMEVHHMFTDMATLQMVPCQEHLFKVLST
jgi:hypothetical protein